MKPTISTIKALVKKYQIDLNVVSLSTLKQGIATEFEHTDNVETAFIIAIEHLSEFPDYYKRLAKMEKSADAYWSKRVKPSIFLSD